MGKNPHSCEVPVQFDVTLDQLTTRSPHERFSQSCKIMSAMTSSRMAGMLCTGATKV